jgi:hypothetical protein
MFALALTVWASAALAADPASTNAQAAGPLLTDRLGRHVGVSTNEVPPGSIRRDPRGWSAKFPNSKRVRWYPSLCWIVPTRLTRA